MSRESTTAPRYYITTNELFCYFVFPPSPRNCPKGNTPLARPTVGRAHAPIYSPHHYNCLLPALQVTTFLPLVSVFIEKNSFNNNLRFARSVTSTSFIVLGGRQVKSCGQIRTVIRSIIRMDRKLEHTRKFTKPTKNI